MFADSMALRHSRESSTDREPKKFTNHCSKQHIISNKSTFHPLPCVSGAMLYLWIKKVCVHHSPLDVIQVGVVLQRPLQEPGLLTQLGHVSPVIVGEHLVAQDGISNLQDKAEGQIHLHTTLENSHLLMRLEEFLKEKS